MSPVYPHFLWTDEAIARLKELWREGLTASQTALQFGVTRNSIMGKWTRLGLVTHVKPREPRTPKQPRERRNWRGDESVQHRINVKRDSDLKLGALTDLPQDESPDAVLWLERKTGCKWPLNETAPISAHLVCGTPRDGEHSYCERHHRLSVSTPRHYSDAELERRKRQGQINLQGEQSRAVGEQ